MHCIRSCNSSPSHFCTWTTTSSLLYYSVGVLSESFPTPDKHAWVIFHSRLLTFMFLSFPVSSCALFGIYPPHPLTNPQSLCPSYGICLSFQRPCFSSTFPSSSFSFPTRLIFFTSIIKTTKTLYTFFCASSAPGSFVELIISLHHTVLIPFSYYPVLFHFTHPLVHTTRFNPHPFPPHMLTTSFVSKPSYDNFVHIHRIWSRLQYTCLYPFGILTTMRASTFN